MDIMLLSGRHLDLACWVSLNSTRSLRFLLAYFCSLRNQVTVLAAFSLRGIGIVGSDVKEY